MELAQYAHLCTIMSNMHHRRAGYPFGTIVDFASDGAGCPLFCLSPLAIHTRNIMEDPRCSLVVQMPGWTGMANARVTIFGDVYQLPPDMHEAAREVLSCICDFCSCSRRPPCSFVLAMHLWHHSFPIFLLGDGPVASCSQDKTWTNVVTLVAWMSAESPYF